MADIDVSNDVHVIKANRPLPTWDSLQMSAARVSRRHVLCVVPRGLDGKGGIDRLFRYLSVERDYMQGGNINVRFFTSRGDAAGLSWIPLFPFRVLWFITLLTFCKIDVLHVNLSINASAYRKYILVSLARLWRKNIIVHFHGGGFEHVLSSSSLSVKLILKILKDADCAIVLGDFWRDLLTRVGGLSADKIRVVYNATPDFGYHAIIPRNPRNSLRILFAGELHPRKGIDILLPALAALDRQQPSWTCVIAGNGDMAPYCDLARDLGIADKTIFTGWIEQKEVQRRMMEADVVILPSRGEGLPLCLVEAACAGAAMVATDQGATREVLEHGVNGLIVPLEADAIASSLAYLASHPQELASMQRSSRETYEKDFDINGMISRLQQAYHEVGPLKARVGTNRRPSANDL